MLRVAYSNDLNELARTFANSLRQARTALPDWLFAPLLIAVPNRTIASFAEFSLASQLGAVGHLQLRPLQELMADAVHEKLGLNVANRDSLTAALHRLFLDKHKLSLAALKPVRSYLSDEAEAAGLDKRRLQLAEHVAQLFLRYASEAPERVELWLATDKPRTKKNLSDEEVWQRELYRQLFLTENAALVPLWTAAQKLSREQLPQTLYLFGHSYLSPLDRRLLGLAQQETAVEVYAFNPCRQFWDDLDFAASSSSQDCAPLSRLGTRNLSTVRFFNQLANYDTIDSWRAEETEQTRLAQLRLAVLDRQPLEPASAVDNSLQFWRAPSPRRELESVAAQIWQNIEADATLGFNDIAIFTPRSKLAEYSSLAPLVFGEVGQLPFQRTVGPSTHELTVLAAIKKLIALPLAPLTRAAVLDFLAEPLVARNLPASRPADWHRWCDNLGIWHGVDESAHAGTYLEAVEAQSGLPSFHWDQGITRLALGRWMASDFYNLRTTPIEISFGSKHYRPLSLADDQIVPASQFGALLRELMGDLKELLVERHTMATWGKKLTWLLEKYIRPDSLSERQTFLEIRAELLKFQELPWSNQAVAYLAAGEWLLEKIGQFFARTSSYVGPGVAILPLADSTALPFRQVFVLGVDEKSFPAMERAEPLDILAQEPDRSPVGSLDFSDRQSLLERLVTTRERVVFSYVEREVRGGDPLEPSPLIQELYSWLYGTAAPDKWRPISPTGNDDTALLRFSETARNLKRAADLAESAPINVTEFVAQHPETHSLLAGDLSAAIAADSDRSTPARKLEQILPIRGLRRFLECPLQGYAEFGLGMRREAERAADLNWEPFAMESYHEYALLDGTLEETLRSQGTRASMANFLQTYHLLERSARHGGQLPHGVFGEAEVAQHLAWLQVWAEKLSHLSLDEKLLRYSMGRPSSELRASVHLPALHFPVGSGAADVDGSVWLRGTSDLLNHDGTVTVLFRQKFAAKEKLLALYKLGLRTFLHHAIFSAAGVAQGAQKVWVISADDTPAIEFSIAALTAERASEYLTNLTRQFVATPHDYLLPCEAVVSAWLENEDAPDLAGWIRKLAEDSNRPISSDFGPIAGARDKPILSPAELYEIFLQRYALFFEVVQIGEQL